MRVIKQWSDIDATITKAIRSLVFIAAGCSGLIMLISVIDVVGAKFFNRGFPSAVGFVEELNVVLIFMAIAYVPLTGGQIRVALFEEKMPKLLRKILVLISHVLGIAVSGFLSWRVLPLLEEMIAKHTVKTGSVPFVTWPFGLITFIGFALLTVAFILCLIREAISMSREHLVKTASSKL